jgi:hypothetical protein
MSDDPNILIAAYTKEAASYTRILATSTVVLTIVTGVIAILTYQMTTNVAQQTNTIHDQLVEMQKAGHQTEGLIADAERQADAAEEGVRAWVRPTLAGFEGPINKDVTNWIKIHFHNFGRLPAERFRRPMAHELHPASLPTDDAERNASQTVSCFGTKLSDHGDVVIPKESDPEHDAYSEYPLPPNTLDGLHPVSQTPS